MEESVEKNSDIDERLSDFFASSSSRWAKLYAPSMQTANDVRKHIERKIEARHTILSHILKYAPPNSRILESAAGTATLSLYLSTQGFECTALDQDADMIILSKMLQEICGGEIKRAQGSFLELPFSNDHFDVVFNHGVLEYFDDPTVIRIIQEQLRVGKRFIFEVPTIWNKALYIEDDEILRSYYHWKKLVENAGGRIQDSYSYFSYRKVRAWLNRVLGMGLQPFSPGVGFVLEKA